MSGLVRFTETPSILGNLTRAIGVLAPTSNLRRPFRGLAVGAAILTVCGSWTTAIVMSAFVCLLVRHILLSSPRFDECSIGIYDQVVRD